MKNRLILIYEWFSKLSQTLVSLIYALFFFRSWISRGMKKEYKERFGRTASLLGNGPSLRHILDDRFDLLENTDIMVVNYFGNTPEFFRIKPRYYIFLDPYFYNTSHRLKEELTKDLSEDNSNLILWTNFQKVDWEMTVFIPQEALKVVSENINNPNINFVVFQAGKVLGFDCFQNLMYRHNMGCPCSRNVALPAMINLINLGYKTIYLYGIDFSWLKALEVDPSNGLTYMNDRHFYNESAIRHFNKGYYKLMLRVLYEDLHGTDQIAKYAKSQGVKMVNRTIGSYVDSFEYENPDTIEK